jgi:hypothetical protein
VTYGNDCEAAAAGVSIAYDEACISTLCLDNADCEWPEYFCEKPYGMCDGDGICSLVPDPETCPWYFAPVCGCDGNTYAGDCYAAAEGVSVDHVGECTPQPSLEDYSNSGCLPSSPTDAAKDQYPWCGDDRIGLSVEGSILNIIHMNATYNCCPEAIEVSLSVEGNLLSLTEREVLANPCDCLCCYNVESTVVGLSPGSYIVEYCWEDYETAGRMCLREEIQVP